ncbi:MAG TPA: YeeE/YedE thiosulfate transporter family protein [Sunxiuqinia sp.]|nr:YeeE/YedE thiosulfate transporter family protein [Sunxiuqinia sp.]
MILLILVFGFLFGAVLQYARLNRFNTISGMATLENLAVAKAIAIAIGVGAILLSVEIGLGLASYHVKPFVFGGIVLGGLIFGTGMAILGYCPGTMAISLGEGSLDALVGIVGGLVSGVLFTILLPSMHRILGPNLGSISLNSLLGGHPFVFYLLVFVIGALFVALAFWLHKLETVKDLKWLYAGIGLAVLNAIVFLSSTFNRPIGASTSYPYMADVLTGTTGNDYFAKIHTPGHWEMIFLIGAILSGLVLSLYRKDFKLTLIHENWKRYKGDSSAKRIAWAFAGGFILIFGARMAGGCTSGHVVSGGMQLAVSSLVFAVFVFIGLLVIGKVFYKMGNAKS